MPAWIAFQVSILSCIWKTETVCYYLSWSWWFETICFYLLWHIWNLYLLLVMVVLWYPEAWLLWFSICFGRLNRKEEAPSCTNGAWKSRAEEDWESNKPPSYLLQEADGVVQEGKRASHSLWRTNRSHHIFWQWQDVWVLQPSMEVRETFFPISYHPSFCSFSSLRGSRNFRYGVVITMVFVWRAYHVVEVPYYP